VTRDLSGKYALVTGVGRGIGKGCALQLAGRGADALCDDLPIHNPESIHQGIRSQTVQATGRNTAVSSDTTSPEVVAVGRQ
jgi:NAD(P)-dependent dehydrogenase (short-subunit alcohol dehydrogenase family)